MKLPAIDNAVHTTPPMIKAASMPEGPFRPTATMTTEARISVMSVMPDTGLLPTMAIALAATVVNRKAMIVTRHMPTMANRMLPSMTPSQKNKNVMSNVTSEPIAIILNGMSRWVRFMFTTPLFLPFSSLEAKPTALLMIPQLFIIPITPAMAMPPMPMERALVKINAEDKKNLKDNGFLTRDSRAVERKKPGQPKARRHFQFSKR